MSIQFPSGRHFNRKADDIPIANPSPQPDIDDSWGGFRVVDSMAREVPGKVTITKEELTALYHRLAAEAVPVIKAESADDLLRAGFQAIPLEALKAIMEIKEL